MLTFQTMWQISQPWKPSAVENLFQFLCKPISNGWAGTMFEIRAVCVCAAETHSVRSVCGTVGKAHACAGCRVRTDGGWNHTCITVAAVTAKGWLSDKLKQHVKIQYSISGMSVCCCVNYSLWLCFSSAHLLFNRFTDSITPAFRIDELNITEVCFDKQLKNHGLIWQKCDQRSQCIVRKNIYIVYLYLNVYCNELVIQGFIPLFVCVTEDITDPFHSISHEWC